MMATCCVCGTRLDDSADFRRGLCSGCLFDDDGDLVEGDDEATADLADLLDRED